MPHVTTNPNVHLDKRRQTPTTAGLTMAALMPPSTGAHPNVAELFARPLGFGRVKSYPLVGT